MLKGNVKFLLTAGPAQYAKKGDRTGFSTTSKTIARQVRGDERFHKARTFHRCRTPSQKKTCLHSAPHAVDVELLIRNLESTITDSLERSLLENGYVNWGWTHPTNSKTGSKFILEENYVLHYRNLGFYMAMGLKIVKIHQILEFDQSRWLKPYIDFSGRLLLIRSKRTCLNWWTIACTGEQCRTIVTIFA